MRPLLLVVALGCAHAPPPERAPDLVRFRSFEGTTLEALLYRPEGEGPQPAVVMLHGCGGLYRPDGVLWPQPPDWGPLLASHGYVVLFPDSLRPRGIAEACTEPNRNRARPEVERTRDAYAALAWLEAQPFVAKGRVAVVGFSAGGNTVLAAIDEATRARAGAAGRFARAVAFYPGCKRFDVSTWTTDVPLIALLGEKDALVPPVFCEDFFRAAKARGIDVDVVLYPNAGHAFDIPMDKRAEIAPFSRPASLGMDAAARADAIGRVLATLGAM